MITPYDERLDQMVRGSVEWAILLHRRDGYLRALEDFKPLVEAARAALPAIRWGKTHQPGNLAQWSECEKLLEAALAPFDDTLGNSPVRG